ncbi:papain-like cysteine protease family protein [Streptomyces sp. NPDC048516]|uniref:papain-like cysteine protease family protein n=1 Tax=Streptomyces sp. NPDC048516 TaxID=3365565 RepID=UPI00371D733A
MLDGHRLPQRPSHLGKAQNAVDWAGVNSGSYVTGWRRYDSRRDETGAGRPVGIRIQWASGSGHTHVIHGYDTDRHRAYLCDPRSANKRYNWGDFDYYVNGSSFSWTHTQCRIGA